MQASLQKFFTDLYTGVSEKWNALERQQKMRLLGGIAVLVIAIAATLIFTFRPKNVVIVANQDIETISEVEKALTNAGVKHKVIENGRSVQIDERDIYEAKIAIEVNTNAEPIIEPESEYSFETMFDNTGIGVSESVKKDMSRVAFENRLAGIIRRMDGISDAIVVLNIPEKQNIFTTENEVTTASVFITEKAPLTPEQATAVANTVVSGVKGLTLNNIVITNQYKQTVFPVPEVAVDEKEAVMDAYEREDQLKREMQSNIYTLLDPMFDEVKVNINIKLDHDKIKEEEILYSPSGEDNNTGVMEYSITGSESAQGIAGSQGGEPGLNSNDLMTESYQTGGNPSNNITANSKSTESSYKVSEKKTIKEYSTGDLVKEESSVAITVYSYKTISEKQMRENGLLGDMSWYEYKLNKKPMMLEIDNYEYLLQSLRTGIGMENLTLVGYELYNFVDEVPSPGADWQQIVIFVILAILILMLAFGLLRRNKEEIKEIEEIIAEAEPELAVEDLLISSMLEEEKEEEVEKIQEIDYTIESESKKQIDKFVDEKPDAVAQLLRNWLQEGWE